MLTFFGTPLVIAPSYDPLSGDAGRLPLRPLDKGIGRTRAFAEARDDPRVACRVDPTHAACLLASLEAAWAAGRDAMAAAV
jgi:hypothetical protein